MAEIRKATPADAESILEYCKCIGGETDNLTFGPEGVPFTVEQEREFLTSILHSDKQLYLVAVNDGAVVGTATFTGFARPRLAHRGGDQHFRAQIPVGQSHRHPVAGAGHRLCPEHRKGGDPLSGSPQ